MPTLYAATTEVPVAKSKVAIETLLRDHGATEFASGWNPTHDTLQFHMRNQTIRFVLPRPDPNDRRFTRDRHGYVLSPVARSKRIDQADRQRWRALYLVIRAKLEAIQSGIAVYEQEFLAFIVDPGTGMTVGDILIPRLEAGKGVAGLLPATTTASGAGAGSTDFVFGGTPFEP